MSSPVIFLSLERFRREIKRQTKRIKSKVRLHAGSNRAEGDGKQEEGGMKPHRCV